MLSAQTYVYVWHGATGENDGSSWTDAYISLDAALSVDLPVDLSDRPLRIWIAAGTYLPESEVGGEGNHFLAFQLKNEVEVYGGFEGTEDPDDFNLNDRDFDANETILSGNLGSGTYVYHVFRHVDIGLDDSAVLDGVTVSGGRADGDDAMDKRGGGMLNFGSSSANGSSPTIRNTVFTDNEATEGGAMYNSRYSSPAVSHTSFLGNTAATKGGAVFNIRNTPSFNHCTFNGNEVTGYAANDGGGAMYNSTSNAAEGPAISHSIFENNKVSRTGTSTYGGGAIYSSLDPGKLHITESTFTGNEAKYGGALYHRSGNNANRDNSDVKIQNSIFEGNEADFGGAIFSDRHNSKVVSCIIRGNEASEQAGGFYSRFAASQIVNSLVSGNKSSKHGGGVYFNSEIVAEIINSTVTGNFAGERGGGISSIGGSTVGVKNTIVWGNASPEGNQLWLCSDCTVNLDHSIYGDATGDAFITTGGTLNATNSLNSDPLFFNPLAPDASNTPNTSGVYMIQSSSPAVDAGNNAYLDDLGVMQDLRDGPRIVDGNQNSTATVDIGAYEYNPTCSSNPPISGTGTVSDPYVIAEPGNFCWLAQNPADWNKHYKQLVDIDLTGSENLDGGKGLRPIGNSTTKFTGTYDGQGYSISNLVINRPNETNVGLFGVIDGQSTQRVVLQNIALVNVTITGNREVGALVGLAEQFNDIINCHVSGSVNGNRNAGGLVVWGRRTDFSRSSSSADVEVINPAGALYHGGLIGHINTTSTVKECFATGNVSGRGRVGGLIGAVGWNSSVENSFARGNVSSDVNNPMIGGLIGEVWNAGVRKSYSTGEINMSGISSEFGGLVGNITTDNNFFDEDNFWDTQTSGLSTSLMGTGKTTAEMKDQDTFTDVNTVGLDDPWDFTTIWSIQININDGYPYLQMQDIYYSRQSGNWADGSTWSRLACEGAEAVPSAPPLPDSPVVICDGHTVTVGDSESANNTNVLIIQGNGSLLVASGGRITLTGTIVIDDPGNGNIHVKSGGLFNNLGTSNPVLTLERTLEGFDDSDPHIGEGWRYLASPVGTTLQDLFQGIRTQGMDGSSFPGALPQNINVFRWNSGFDGNNPEVGETAGWMPVEDLGDYAEAGEGILVYVFVQDEAGEPVPFPKTLSVTGQEFGDKTNDSQILDIPLNQNDDGWTLLGNPYATSIRFADLLEISGNEVLHEAIYVWTPNNTGDKVTPDPEENPPPYSGSLFTSGSWMSYTLAGENGNGVGELTDGLIAPFQAFFVQTDGEPESGSTLSFSNLAKSSNSDDTQFLFRETAAKDVVRMELSGRGMRNAAWLQLSGRGSHEGRVSGDAYQLHPHSPDYALLGMWKENGEGFDIGHFSTRGLQSGRDIPLMAEATRPGRYRIAVTDYRPETDLLIYLNDMEAGFSVPLAEGMTYELQMDGSAAKFGEDGLVAGGFKPPGHPLRHDELARMGKDQEKAPRFLISINKYGEDPPMAAAEIPEEVSLAQNFPNPFNPATVIRYGIPQEGLVRLTVYDILGRRVAVLVDGHQKAGRHDITWDAMTVSSGIYIYRLEAGGKTLTRTMTLLK